MAIPSNQLFLDRFIEYNSERYKDNPSLVAMFQGLTLDKVELTNLRETTLENGKPANLFDIKAPGVFTGKNQMFYPADYLLHNVADISKDEPVTLEDLPAKDTPGVYKVLPTGGSALMLKGGKTEVGIKTLIEVKALYDITDAQITINPDLSSLTIKSPTIVGTLYVTESMFDDLLRYNGKHRADGSVRAL